MLNRERRARSELAAALACVAALAPMPLVAAPHHYDAQQIDRLLEALERGPEGARNRAAQRLYHLQDRRGNAGVLALAAHREPRLRATGVWALTVVRPPGAARLLLSSARDASPAVRRAAVQGLGLLKPPGAQRQLRASVRDRDAEVQRKAVWALGRLGTAGIAGLQEALRQPPLELQLLALRALAEQPASKAALRVLLWAARKSSPRVRAFAAYQLVRQKDRRGAQELAAIVARTREAGLRLQIVRYLADDDGEPGRRALEKLLRQPDPQLRSAAAEALAARLLRRRRPR